MKKVYTMMMLRKIINCKYYGVEQIQTLKVPKNSLKMFHINPCSLNKNFDDLEYLLKPKKYQLRYYCNISNKNNEKFRNYSNINLKKYYFEKI